MNRKKLSVIFFVGFAIIAGCGKSVSEIKDSNLVENDVRRRYYVFYRGDKWGFK